MSRILANLLIYSVAKPLIKEAIKSINSEPTQSLPEKSELIEKDGDVLLDGDKIFWEGSGTYTFRGDGKAREGWFPITEDSGSYIVEGKTLLVLFINSERKLDYKLYENS